MTEKVVVFVVSVVGDCDICGSNSIEAIYATRPLAEAHLARIFHGHISEWTVETAEPGWFKNVPPMHD